MTSQNAYASFLARKRVTDPATGLAAVPALPAFLFPHQHDIVSWALRRGRAAIFAGIKKTSSVVELLSTEACAS